MKRVIVAAAAALLAAAPLAAQQPAPRTDRVGHVVAIVGDSAILNFDIREGVLARQAGVQREIPEGSAEYREVAQEVLENRITELLIVQAALRDTTIRVMEDQVSRLVQQRIEDDQRQTGGAAGLEAALRETGLTLGAYRERLAAQYRKQALMEQFRGRIMRARKAPPVTEAELREAFEEHRVEFGSRPATISYHQVVVPTQATPEALAEARARADAVFARIRAGEDFATLARQHGEDPSREQGGDLGWSRRGEWDRDFANVAFSMRAGDVSSPVLTRFGYHLIKVERVRGAEIQMRHILFKPKVTDADALRARARADSAAQRLREGADAVDVARQFGDRDQPARIGPLERGPTQERLGIDLTGAEVGQVYGPIPVGSEEIASDFLVVRIAGLEPEREWSLEDAVLRDRLRQQVETVKLIEEVVAELRRSTYVEIRGF